MKKLYKFLLVFIATTGSVYGQSGLQLNPTVYAGGVHITCFGASDGAVSVTPTAGIPPYSYVWTGPNAYSSVDSSISNLEPGKYTITVVDALFDTYQDSITLLSPDALSSSGILSSFYGGNNISCAGASDGSIDLTIAGGVALYNYYWTGPAGFVDSINEDLSGLSAGTYNVMVTDQNGCVTSNSFQLVAPAPLQIVSISSPTYISGHHVSCFDAGDGSIDLQVVGGSGSYTYLWNGPQGISSLIQDPQNLHAGFYQVTVVDDNGCTASAAIQLTEPQQLTAVTQPLLYNGSVNVSCYGANDGQVTLTPTGGTPPYTYSWTGPNGFTSTNKDLANVMGGTYTCLITDDLGCQFQETINLEEPDSLKLSDAVITDLICFGDGDGSIVSNVSGGIVDYTYNWTGPNGFTSTSSNINNLNGGMYTLTVTDFNGCVKTMTYEVFEPAELIVDLYSPLQPSNNFNYHISYHGGNDGSIDATSIGGTGTHSYSWSGPGFTSTSQNVTGLTAGVYTVTVTDQNSCQTVRTIELTQPEALELTQGFSPNNDGIHDSYQIHGLEAYPDNNFVVFNRFGNEVYSQSGYLAQWMGTNNDGEDLPAGTYFVILQIRNPQGTDRSDYKGYVEIRR